VAPDTGLIALVIQTGFAGLFVWLLFDTRKESRERQTRSYERETQFALLLSEQSKLMAQFAMQLGQVAAQLGAIQEVSIREVEQITALRQEMGRQSIDILQMRGLLGERRATTHELTERIEKK